MAGLVKAAAENAASALARKRFPVTAVGREK
jgi:hypothetical protein